jgi:hypothetical protein
MEQTRLLLDFATIGVAMLLMVRGASHFKLLVRRRSRHCASCGRELPARCVCRRTR